jgi:uncharacterized cupredoxin-like copper-binding protein
VLDLSMKTFLLAISLGNLGAAFAHGEAMHAGKKDRSLPVEERAFGREGDPARATRTVRVIMADTMRFTPSSVTIQRGETVKFVVRNNGKVKHEMVIGTMDELKAHAEMMKKHPGMEHDEPYMAHVAPGRTGTIAWQFTKAGEFQFGCLMPGHFEAGMIGQIRVVANGDGK